MNSFNIHTFLTFYAVEIDGGFWKVADLLASHCWNCVSFLPSYVQAEWEMKNIDISVNSPGKIYTEVIESVWLPCKVFYLFAKHVYKMS